MSGDCAPCPRCGGPIYTVKVVDGQEVCLGCWMLADRPSRGAA